MDEKPVRTSLVSDIENKLSKWFDSLTNANLKTFVIVSSVVALILMVLASLSSVFGFDSYIEVIIGTPAALIVAVLLYYFLEYRKLIVTKYKNNVLHKKRVTNVIIFWAVLLPVLIFSSDYIPVGLGGVLIINSFLWSVVVLRRTDGELYYYMNGLVDPRELEKEEE